MARSRISVSLGWVTMTLLGSGVAYGVSPAEPSSQVAIVKTVGSGFSVGDAIGVARTGAECRDTEERAWSPLVRDRLEETLRAAFAKEAARSSSSPAWRGDRVRVDAFVNNLRFDLCGSGSAWRGSADVQVSWTVTSPTTGSVLYQASTRGSVGQAAFQAGKSSEAMQKAVQIATRTFLSDTRLRVALDSDRRSELHAGR